MKYKKRREIEKNRQEILFLLPSFINNLLLLLNSGMVLREAMNVVAINYEKANYDKNQILAYDYINLYYEAKNNGNSIVNLFYAYASQSQIKELSRLGRILLDGEKRGIDLTAKLYEESKNIWEQKKQLALEQIRLKESKMSFPLGLLLISLIIISAAPAMMQMYI